MSQPHWTWDQIKPGKVAQSRGRLFQHTLANPKAGSADGSGSTDAAPERAAVEEAAPEAEAEAEEGL